MNRKKKIILNTFLILLCSFFLWSLKGFPLWNKYELRRLEENYLLPKGEILTEVDTRVNGPIYWVGKTEGYAEVFQIRDGIIFPDNQPMLFLYELYEDSTIVILPKPYFGSGELMGAYCVFVYDSTPEATGAILTIGSKEFTGERCADGLIKFAVHHGEDLVNEFPPEMTVTYLDASGQTLSSESTPVSIPVNYYDIYWTRWNIKDSKASTEIPKT